MVKYLQFPLVKPELLKKALSSTCANLFGIMTPFNRLFLNAPFPINSTLSGIITSVKWQLAKALSSILVTVFGILTLVYFGGRIVG